MRPVSVITVLIPVLLAVQVQAAPLDEAIKALAEDVLGEGAVKSFWTAASGTQISIRWESVTYKPANDLATTRELIYGEAVLATGSVLGQLQRVVRIRFTIVRGDRMLATGENWRGRGVSLAFSTELGGGTYKAPEPKIDPKKKPGGDVAKEV